MELNDFMSKFSKQEESLEPEQQGPIMLSAGAPQALGAFLEKFTTLTESYFFYGGTIELRFDKENHKYYKVDPELGNLIEQLGVTNTVHIIDRSVALTPWAAKKVAEKILRTVPVTSRDFVVDVANNISLPVLYVPEMKLEDFTQLVMEAKTAPKDILIEAGDIGHIAHKCLEDSIQHAIDHNNGIVKELLYIPEDEKAASCARAALDWMRKHNVRWIKTEQKIYSREYEYAGTMDGSAFVDSCDDPSCCAHLFKDHRSLIDWKSSNYLYIEYCYQTASYLGAEVEEYGIPFDDRWILRLGKNEEEAGKFEPWYLAGDTFAEDFAGFLACLNLTKLVHSVDKRMQAQKKGVRAAQKKQKAEQKEIAKMKAKVEKEAERAQKKLDRATERERIKAEAKLNREEAKRAKRNGVVPLLDTGNITGAKAGHTTKLEVAGTNTVSGEATDPSAVAEVRPTEYRDEKSSTAPSAVASETVTEATKLTQVSQSLSICESVRIEPQSVSQNAAHDLGTAHGAVVNQEHLVEESFSHKPFVIPEEG